MSFTTVGTDFLVRTVSTVLVTKALPNDEEADDALMVVEDESCPKIDLLPNKPVPLLDFGSARSKLVISAVSPGCLGALGVRGLRCVL